MTVDSKKLEMFLGQVVTDLGAVLHAATVVVGDALGLYKALSEAPATAAELAARTGTDRRYILEWLSAQAASGYAHYDAASERFSLSPEQAMALATEGGVASVAGGFQFAVAQFAAIPKVIAAFKTGDGIGWHEQDESLFCGMERFMTPVYAAKLTQEWLPSLDGIVSRLEAGGRVADVGCGAGGSTILMAQAYPASTFVGFDIHEPSLERARARAAAAGVADRVRFEAATAKTFPGPAYDLVTVFDCLHDMGDPVGAATHIRSRLTADGTWMIVEPFAKDRREDNLHPLGRVFYSGSTFVCTPASRSQEVGLCLGSQAGQAALADVARQGGFSRVRQATESPFNIILEARI